MENIKDITLEAIRSSMPKPLQDKEIELTHNMSDLGVDSLGFMTITVALETALGISLGSYVAQLVQTQNVGELIQLVAKVYDQQFAEAS